MILSPFCPCRVTNGAIVMPFESIQCPALGWSLKTGHHAATLRRKGEIPSLAHLQDFPAELEVNLHWQKVDAKWRELSFDSTMNWARHKEYTVSVRDATCQHVQQHQWPRFRPDYHQIHCCCPLLLLMWKERRSVGTLRCDGRLIFFALACSSLRNNACCMLLTFLHLVEQCFVPFMAFLLGTRYDVSNT